MAKIFNGAGITVKELRTFMIKAHFNNIPDETPIKIVKKDEQSVASDVKEIIADEDSVVFYDYI